jgi:protein O-mannosyl-transferase
MHQYGNMRPTLTLGALLGLATLAVFWPVLQNEFINYDDPNYVTANEVVNRGLSLEGVQWAFTTGHASNWHPVTWLSHMLDVTMFGLQPTGHHLTNLLLHVANSVLLLLFLWRMTGALWRSALAATLFALHPLHVESVAWVSERKDVLSAFFGILTLMSYSHYAQCQMPNAKFPNGRKVWYGVALVLFALGLMSKPMLVTWPFVLVLLDFWPLRRMDLATHEARRTTFKPLLLEKLPFLALAITSCVVTVIVQSDALAKTELVPLSARLGNAVLAYVDYLGQTLWPAGLAVFYPFPLELTARRIIAASAVLLVISAATLRLSRTQPYVIMGWLWYLGTLVPVIGLVQVGSQARADRYTYLPLIGIFIMMAWGLGALVQACSRSKWLVQIASVLMLAALSVTTHRQTEYWRNSRTLFAYSAQVTRGNYVALSGVGIADALQGDWHAAMTNLTQALEFARLHHAEQFISYYLGVTLQMQGRGLEALPYLENALVPSELRPERNYRLGLSLLEANRLSEAETALKDALADKPQSAEYQLGMAALFIRQGNLAEAEPVYQATLASHPTSPVAQKSFGDFLTLAGRYAEAESHHAAAVKLKPGDALFRRAYAKTLRNLGKLSEAIVQLEAAARLGLVNSEAAAELAELYSVQGQSAKAVVWYQKAIENAPKSISALNNLAWILATDPNDEVRDGKHAVELAERACQLTEWKKAVLMGTLAAAYAEAGRFPDAVAMAGKARDQAHADQQETIAKKNEELLKLYEYGKPFRDK